jgi:hypothetical protein
MVKNKQDLLHHAEMETYFNSKNIQHMREKLTAFDNDLKSEERKSKQLCKHCFYVKTGRIAGQAFTNHNCGLCDKLMTFPTTDTDDFCLECAEEISVCKHCGAKID